MACLEKSSKELSQKMGNIIEKFDDSLIGINDQRITDLKQRKLADLDFLKSLTSEDPYYVRNKTLMSVDAPSMVQEIERVRQFLKKSPPELRLMPDILEKNTEPITKVFPELIDIVKEVQTKIADASCKGCARNKEIMRIQEVLVELQKKDLTEKKERDLSSLKGIVTDLFIESWTKPLEDVEKHLMLPRIQIMTSPEEMEAMRIGHGHHHSLPPPPIRNVEVSRIPESLPQEETPLLNATSKPVLDANGNRKACRDCFRKHVAQAQVLLNETMKGYPEHIWLAIGHLAEAEDEILADSLALATEAREMRVQVMKNPTTRPDLVSLILKSIQQ